MSTKSSFVIIRHCSNTVRLSVGQRCWVQIFFSVFSCELLSLLLIAWNIYQHTSWRTTKHNTFRERKIHTLWRLIVFSQHFHNLILFYPDLRYFSSCWKKTGKNQSKDHRRIAHVEPKKIRFTTFCDQWFFGVNN